MCVSMHLWHTYVNQLMGACWHIQTSTDAFSHICSKSAEPDLFSPDGWLTPVPVCPQLTREYFSRELKRHYQGHNNTDVFTSTWNAIMTTVRRWFSTYCHSFIHLFFYTDCHHTPPPCTVRLLWCEWAWGLWREPLQTPQPEQDGARGLLPEEQLPRRRERGAVCERQRGLQAQQGLTKTISDEVTTVCKLCQV